VELKFRHENYMQIRETLLKILSQDTYTANVRKGKLRTSIPLKSLTKHSLFTNLTKQVLTDSQPHNY